MKLSAEQQAEFTRLQGMSLEDQLAAAETVAARAEAEGNAPLAQALRQTIGQRRAAPNPGQAARGSQRPAAAAIPQPQPLPSARTPRRAYTPPAVEDVGSRQQFNELLVSNAELHRQVSVLARDLAELRQAVTIAHGEQRETRDVLQKLSDAWQK